MYGRCSWHMLWKWVRKFCYKFVFDLVEAWNDLKGFYCVEVNVKAKTLYNMEEVRNFWNEGKFRGKLGKTI